MGKPIASQNRAARATLFGFNQEYGNAAENVNFPICGKMFIWCLPARFTFVCPEWRLFGPARRIWSIGAESSVLRPTGHSHRAGSNAARRQRVELDSRSLLTRAADSRIHPLVDEDEESLSRAIVIDPRHSAYSCSRFEQRRSDDEMLLVVKHADRRLCAAEWPRQNI